MKRRGAFGWAFAAWFLFPYPGMAGALDKGALLTPPMGWNSYDAYGTSINESETLANAIVLRDKLLPHGYDTLVIDARWYDGQPVNDDREFNTKRVGAKLAADAYGRLLPAPNRFPSAAGGLGFKPLADSLHAMGLRFGIHIMRGIPRQAAAANSPIEGCSFRAKQAGDTASVCSWCPDMYGVKDNAAGQAWYDSLFRLYASWGLDFVKVDDLSQPYATREIEMIRRAMDKCGRRMVFSTSPGPTDPKHSGHISTHADMWRISGDFWDEWGKLGSQFDLMDAWREKTVPGRWPDADMIPLGHLALRNWINGGERKTRFTPAEQRSLMSFWCLAPSPLMLGMGLTDLDKDTLGIVANDEVLALNQDAALRQAVRVRRKPDVWVKSLRGGAWALGIFNRSTEPLRLEGGLSAFGFREVKQARDLWKHRDLSPAQALGRVIPPHACTLLRLVGSWTMPPRPSPTPMPQGRVYEAEQAELSGGAAAASDHLYYSGSGFVMGYYQGTGQRTLFRVKSGTGGKYHVFLRYSNGMGAVQTLRVQGNTGKPFRLSLPPTEGWDDWAEVGFDLALEKGNNDVAILKEKGDGCVNLDYLRLP